MARPEFRSILTPGRKIETPEEMKQITGHEPRLFAVADQVYMHFPDVRTQSEAEQVIAAFVMAAACEIKGEYWGDELVASLPKAAFQSRFAAISLK